METTNHDPARALRRLPAVDALLQLDSVRGLPRSIVVRSARALLDDVRRSVLDARLDADGVDAMFAAGGAGAQRLRELCDAASARHHRRVVNGTGIVLHTGIGRAPLADVAKRALVEAAGYSVVELDPVSGKRNHREVAVSALLNELCGTTGALVVNNNAAMVNLVLRTFGDGREVVVSRGELVEIGGGFRMPDVMAAAGCKMVEVGATNRTHLRDYERAIGEDTALLTKVHPSNYRIEGFHSTPTLAELAELGARHDVPVYEDLGSGLICDGPLPGLEDEARVLDSVASKAPLISFSGDKLLGGPQCGILVGDRELVARARAHPLYRAYRCDKLKLAALEATLRVYRDGSPRDEIPTLRAITMPVAELEVAAERLAAALADHGARVEASESFVGSGANPARPIPSRAVSLPGGERVADRLRAAPTPGDVGVFSRIVADRVCLDLRTLILEDLDEVANLVRSKLS